MSMVVALSNRFARRGRGTLSSRGGQPRRGHDGGENVEGQDEGQVLKVGFFGKGLSFKIKLHQNLTAPRTFQDITPQVTPFSKATKLSSASAQNRKRNRSIFFIYDLGAKSLDPSIRNLSNSDQRVKFLLCILIIIPLARNADTDSSRHTSNPIAPNVFVQFDVHPDISGPHGLLGKLPDFFDGLWSLLLEEYYITIYNNSLVETQTSHFDGILIKSQTKHMTKRGV
ncbi:chaperone protein DnaK [Striga asiatica]|uniref:Chaperone protein DnaK n=1 Tax=Striga asiatica TaxID=4170 RepID=A0A5A7P4Z9_STRAF|nr:chaperone protein DnaK [Striga asiatica]